MSKKYRYTIHYKKENSPSQKSFQDSIDLYIYDLVVHLLNNRPHLQSTQHKITIITNIYLKDETHLSIGKIADMVDTHYKAIKNMSTVDALLFILEKI